MSEEVQVPFGQDREALYAQASGEELTPEGEAGASVDTATKEETTPVQEYTAEPPVKEEAETVKEEKTVPYGALKEEREKRKAIQKDYEETQRRLQQVLSDFQAHVQKETKGSDEPEVIEDYDKEIIEARRTIKEMKAELDALKGNFQSEQQRKAKADLDQKLTEIGSDLEKEGFPGFYQLIGQVESELAHIAENDVDEARSLNTPEGLKKIYREKVFSKFATIFTKKEAEERTNKKVAAKQEAQGAVLTPGTAPAGEKTSSEWNYDDYLKVRNTGFAGGLAR